MNETPYDEEVPLIGVIELGAQRAINVTTQRAQLDQALATGVINQDAYALALQTIESIGAEPQSTAPVLSEVLEIVPGRYTIDGLLIYGGLLQIPEDEKGRRLTILQEKQRAIQIRRNSEMIGNVEEVMVEGYNKATSQWIGRTSQNKTLNFAAAAEQTLGAYVPVRVLRAGPNSLVGECLN